MGPTCFTIKKIAKFNVMNKAILFLILMAFQVSAQDTIRFKNGEMQAVKVTEISVAEIKYARFNIADGPVYVVNKSDVASIKYANGQIDKFDVAPTPAAPVATQPITVVPNVHQLNDKIIIRGRHLYYMSSPVGEGRLSNIMMSVEDKTKQRKMMVKYGEMKSYKAKQYAWGWGSLGAAAVVFIAGVSSSSGGGALIGLVAAPGIVVTGQVIASINKKKRHEKMVEAARVYNGEL